MFGLFKRNPTAKLRKQYEAKLEQAMLYQRKGDIRNYSMTTLEAENLLKQIEELERT